MAFRTGIAPATLTEEDPDMLSTLLAVVEFADKEAERRARQRK